MTELILWIEALPRIPGWICKKLVSANKRVDWLYVLMIGLGLLIAALVGYGLGS